MDSYDLESYTKVVQKSNSEQDRLNIFPIRLWHQNGAWPVTPDLHNRK